MAFVPGFEQDVFISYAHVDDEPFYDAVSRDQSAGWVTRFVRHLQNLLAQEIGRVEAFTVWFDSHNLRGNYNLNPETAAVLDRTAIFVAILSPSYVASQWCQAEAHLFSQRFAKDLAGRVFVVEKAPLDDYAAVPQALTGRINYRFWYHDRNEQPRTFAEPMPQQEEIQYFRQVEDIARDIHRQLIVMGRRPADVSPATPQPRATRYRAGEERRAEALQQAEEERQRAEAAWLADEERQRAEALRQAEEERQRAEGARQAEAERQIEEATAKAFTRGLLRFWNSRTPPPVYAPDPLAVVGNAVDRSGRPVPWRWERSLSRDFLGQYGLVLAGAAVVIAALAHTISFPQKDPADLAGRPMEPAPVEQPKPPDRPAQIDLGGIR